MINLIIDNREKSLIELFQKNNINITKKNLDIGDITYEYNNNPVIIIERKSLEDLSNSIKDGRYKEQKYRLINGVDKKVRKIYIIEGNTVNNFGLPLTTLFSCIVNTIVRDEIFVIQTKSLENTYEYLIKILEQLPKYVDNLFNDGCTPRSYVDSCKLIKKSNFNKEMFQIQQLSLIPGISISLSKLILENIGGMRELYLRTNEKKEELLKDISEIKHGKSERKIGKKLAERIINYL